MAGTRTVQDGLPARDFVTPVTVAQRLWCDASFLVQLGRSRRIRVAVMSERHICLIGVVLLAGLIAGCAGRDATSATPPARNVILFIGDGMGPSTVTAARIFAGQAEGLAGEEYSLSFERFPHLALVKTYNSNQQVADSAGTASAIATGRKTRAGVISIGPDAHRLNCEEALSNPLTSIAEIAHARGLDVGIVSTARITHATPAAFYAHSAEREWESDRYIPESAIAAGCRDIARQLVDGVPGALDIVLGGGRREFFGADHGGQRLDPEANLVHQWLTAADDRHYVSTAAELRALPAQGSVFGLFSASHMTYVAERGGDSNEPSLTEMTATAIDRLAGGDGYFLMVEGGRIDHGHHDGKPGYALVEAREFALAVETAVRRVDLSDTLILVTADHSHAFTMSGYPTRGNPILGLVVENDPSGEPNDGPALATDGKPYTTLGYANGINAVGGVPRPVPDTGIGVVYQSMVSIPYNEIDGTITYDETHGGEDVALYAIGAGSGNVSGVIEQDVVFDIMLKAWGWPASE
jgi:alkaline phosphatase